MTLEEQRAIQEEVRSTGITEAEDKVQALREEKTTDKAVPGVGPLVPGRDSGFCSEQDQLAQQGQGLCRSKPSCTFLMSQSRVKSVERFKGKKYLIMNLTK